MELRHFLSITDLTKEEFMSIIRSAVEIKKDRRERTDMSTLTMGMIFEKPSLRTRVSFEAGMTDLGGHAIYLGPNDIKMGERESPSDVGKVSARMVDIIMARTFEHKTLEELAKGSTVPVINALSDLEHPCQILADFQTIYEEKGDFEKLKIVFIGDGNNNVTHSLALASGLVGATFEVASPKGYEMDSEILKKAQELASKSGGKVEQMSDPKEVAKSADVVITDTWVSMGDEEEKEKRLKAFKGFQVDDEMMGLAKEDAIFMHCLPAYRGKEVSASVIDGPQSVVIDEAENRLHAQKALILFLSKFIDKNRNQVKSSFSGQDFIEISQLDNREKVMEIFVEADKMKEIVEKGEMSNALEGRVVAELFFQPSTRTFTSFLAAIKRLGGKSIQIQDMNTVSSAKKGESLKDTIRSIHQTTGADLIVMRNPEDDSAERAAKISTVPIVNAGSGKVEHPTQAVLDLYTIWTELGKMKDLNVTFVGDLKYGRTVKSLAKLLAVVDDGLSLKLVSPEELKLPDENKKQLKEQGVEFVEFEDSLSEAVKDTDVLYMTRIQREWFKKEGKMDLYNDIKDDYILTPNVMKSAKKDMIVMHPLPRVNEITVDVDDDPRAVYFRQMRNGLYTRMALLKLILG